MRLKPVRAMLACLGAVVRVVENDLHQGDAEQRLAALGAKAMLPR
jgi:hypothetical protein